MTVFSTRAVVPSDASEFEAYAYPSPYELYDSARCSAERFLDPANRYFSVVDRAGALWGFGCLGREAQVPGGSYFDSRLDLGAGMNPTRAGRGHGRAFCAAIVDHARTPADRLQVTVAEFNVRSQRVWEYLGFEKVHEFRHPESGRAFVQLVEAPD